MNYSNNEEKRTSVMPDQRKGTCIKTTKMPTPIPINIGNEISQRFSERTTDRFFVLVHVP